MLHRQLGSAVKEPQMSQKFGAGDKISYCSPLVLQRDQGPTEDFSQDSCVLCRSTASEEVAVWLVSPAHWCIMTVSSIR